MTASIKWTVMPRGALLGVVVIGAALLAWLLLGPTKKSERIKKNQRITFHSAFTKRAGHRAFELYVTNNSASPIQMSGAPVVQLEDDRGVTFSFLGNVWNNLGGAQLYNPALDPRKPIMLRFDDIYTNSVRIRVMFDTYQDVGRVRRLLSRGLRAALPTKTISLDKPSSLGTRLWKAGLIDGRVHKSEEIPWTRIEAKEEH